MPFRKNVIRKSQNRFNLMNMEAFPTFLNSACKAVVQYFYIIWDKRVYLNIKPTHLIGQTFGD